MTVIDRERTVVLSTMRLDEDCLVSISLAVEPTLGRQ